MKQPALPLTGERTTPGVAEENYWFQRHVAAYRFAAQRCAPRRTLDAGSGEGYGTRLLQAAGCDVVGVEIDPRVVRHARETYPGVAFVHGDVCALPLADASVDAVVSLQVIEHVADPHLLVAEAARVLRPGGEFVCATPNRLTFTPDPAAPRNPFHVHEFSGPEIVATLSPLFRVTALLGLHHARRLRAIEALAREGLPATLVTTPPEAWKPWLRNVVSRVRPDDFELRADRLDQSLDLIAVATRRPAIGREQAQPLTRPA